MSDTADAQLTDAEWEQSAQPAPEQVAPEETTNDETFIGDGLPVDGHGNSAVAPSSPQSDAPEAEQKPVKKTRRKTEKGWLEASVKRITDSYVTGEFKPEHPLTPHRVARLVHKAEQLDYIPSTGAVSAVYLRWLDLQFATFESSPFRFIDYSKEGYEKGLAAMKAGVVAQRQAKREAALEHAKAERRAEREAKAEEKRQAQEAEKEAKRQEREAAKEAKRQEREQEKARKAEEKRLAREAAKAEKKKAVENPGETVDNSVPEPVPEVQAEGNEQNDQVSEPVQN